LTEKLPLGSPLFLGFFFYSLIFISWGGKVKTKVETNKKTFYIMVVEVIVVGIHSAIPNWLKDLFTFDVSHLFLKLYLLY
jgi:hypothetical protein